MTRHPASDERSVLGPPAKYVKGERFFLVEIARFLRCSRGDLAKFLRREGQLRELYPGPCRDAVRWTTARGFALAVAHFRAIQGAKYLKGRDPLRDMDQKNAAGARKKALLKGAGYPPRG